MTTLALALTVLATPAVAPDWPPYVTNKTLYADNDFRGKQAPKIEGETFLTGKLPDLKGKVILVDIWATWCGPCRALIPELNEWQAKFKDDLVIIGISDEPSATVSKFMSTTPMKYNVAIDTKKRVSKALGVKGIPHVIVMSKDMIVRYQGFPQDDADKLTTEKLKQIIDANKMLK